MLTANLPIVAFCGALFFYILFQYMFSEQPCFHLCMCTGPFWLTQSFSPCLSVSSVTSITALSYLVPAVPVRLTNLRCIKNFMLALDEFWMSSNPSNSAERAADFSLFWGVPLECMKDICMFHKNSHCICTSSESV